MIVATRPEPTVRPPSRSDFAYLETYLLRFCRFLTHFMGILPIICLFPGKCSKCVSRISATIRPPKIILT